MISAVSGISVTMMSDEPSRSCAGMEGRDMEPRAVGRFSETMAEEVEEQAQTLSPYALDRATGFHVKVRNVEGL
jgi:hypothetical protein